jgi:phosphate:Na+ symporter
MSYEVFAIATRLLGSLALLIFGMKVMSETLQKMAGPGLRHLLGQMTTNRVTGMLTGVMVTAAVQSSTATTVMTVSFVNAGLLTLAQAISVIMGANIGTTLTAWIMSAGFAFNITNLVWPVFLIAMFLIYRKKHEDIGLFLFGISFMFLGLGTLRQTGMDMNLGEQPVVLNFFSSFDPNSFTTTLLFLLIGGVLTMMCQSSAAVMAITMILCSSGALPIYQGIALVMGENIGTTVTSNLAALTASTQARRAAFAHMFFNVFGVCWILFVFHPFIDFVCGLVGFDTEMTKETAGQAAFLANTAKLSVVLAAFHTCFNVLNTSILIWFIPQLERLVCWVIKDKEGDKVATDDHTLRLQYIQSNLVHTPEIAVWQAQRETAQFGERVEAMFNMVLQLMKEKDLKKFVQLYSEIEMEEDMTDQLEIAIANYLEQLSDNHLSDDTKSKIRQMMRQVDELESIGDACYNLARIWNRINESKENLTETQSKNLQAMLQLCQEALIQMNIVVAGRREDQDTKETFRIENEINLLRQRLKSDNIDAVNEHEYSYVLGTMYSDFFNECEKLGDYVVNVVQARLSR